MEKQKDFLSVVIEPLLASNKEKPIRELNDLTLLVYLNKVSTQKLIDSLCLYTGCKPEDYSNDDIIRIFEDALSDISNKYHIKNLVWTYFYTKRTWTNYAKFAQSNYKYDELNVLCAPFLEIPVSTFDYVDIKKLNELRDKYCKRGK